MVSTSVIGALGSTVSAIVGTLRTFDHSRSTDIRDLKGLSDRTSTRGTLGATVAVMIGTLKNLFEPFNAVIRW